MVQASAMSVDDEGDPIWIDPELALKDSESGPGVPEAYQVGSADHKDKICRLQRGPVRCRLSTQQLGPDVEDHIAIPTPKLLDQSIEKSRGDSGS
jgi:hypothetical protein